MARQRPPRPSELIIREANEAYRRACAAAKAAGQPPPPVPPVLAAYRKKRRQAARRRERQRRADPATRERLLAAARERHRDRAGHKAAQVRRGSPQGLLRLARTADGGARLVVALVGVPGRQRRRWYLPGRYVRAVVGPADVLVEDEDGRTFVAAVRGPDGLWRRGPRFDFGLRKDGPGWPGVEIEQTTPTVPPIADCSRIQDVPPEYLTLARALLDRAREAGLPVGEPPA
jgi:hypothetical protein